MEDVVRDRLTLGLAAVFAGLTTVLAVAAVVKQPFLLLVALPFAATTYFLWYHASGRLAARAHREQARANRRADGNGAGPRARWNRAGTGRRRRTAGSRTAGSRRRSRANGRSPTRSDSDRLTRAEAFHVLGLDADADPTRIKRAYREKVKEHHPDTATGDEETFKRVTRAYDRLSEE